jgi:hypothetical protein
MEANVIITDSNGVERGGTSNPVYVVDNPAKQTATVIPVSWAKDSATSAEIDTLGYTTHGILIPDSFDSATLSFLTSTTSGGSFRSLYSGDGTEVTVTGVATNRMISFDTVKDELAPWQYIEIRSGSAATIAEQSATVTTYLVSR